jgi:transmembrane sensor
METNLTYYTELLHRYFSGESTPKELKEISEWIKKDDANLKEFEELNKTNLLLQKSTIEKNIEVDDEWAKFKTAVSPTQQEIYTLKPERNVRKFSLIRVIQVAAIFIFVAIGGLFIINDFSKVEVKVLTTSNETINASLPDGTKVKINAGTTLSYPSKFKEAKRKVKLDGEAYFEVKHDELQPFLITAENICVEVLGTSFYVNTNAPGNNVDVKVTTGRVAVYYSDKPENKIILKAGENTSLSKTEQDFPASENIMPSVSEKIEFTDQPLSNIVSRLNRIYKSDIRLASGNIGDCRMTATIENQSLDAVLNVIKSTLDLQITRKGNSIIISGKGCK